MVLNFSEDAQCSIVTAILPRVSESADLSRRVRLELHDSKGSSIVRTCIGILVKQLLLSRGFVFVVAYRLLVSSNAVRAWKGTVTLPQVVSEQASTDGLRTCLLLAPMAFCA